MGWLTVPSWTTPTPLWKTLASKPKAPSKLSLQSREVAERGRRRSTPPQKKIKHKRTKVKLATLKLYKVDDVGKLERKRKECPQEMCGAGIFLSNHKDRQYCGKCGLTIKYNENQ